MHYAPPYGGGGIIKYLHVPPYVEAYEAHQPQYFCLLYCFLLSAVLFSFSSVSLLFFCLIPVRLGGHTFVGDDAKGPFIATQLNSTQLDV